MTSGQLAEVWAACLRDPALPQRDPSLWATVAITDPDERAAYRPWVQAQVAALHEVAQRSLRDGPESALARVLRDRGVADLVVLPLVDPWVVRSGTRAVVSVVALDSPADLSALLAG